MITLKKMTGKKDVKKKLKGDRRKKNLVEIRRGGEGSGGKE